MSFLKVFLAAFVFYTSASSADNSGCTELVFNELKHLNNSVESYPFRVWYATKGKHKIRGSKEINILNENPEIISDLLLQLHSADKYFSNKLGLIQPLLQPRYNQARFIDVHLVKMEKGNGVAFDEVIAEKTSADAPSFSCGIKIRINKDLDFTKNVTPAHELFHMYQYSNSMFKVGWYLEGMARWVEQAFIGPDKSSIDKIEPVSCTDVYKESYSASRYWRDLARRKKSKDIFIDEEFLALKYSNGRPVFKIEYFLNGSVIKSVFNNLAKESLNISVENKLSPYVWPEKTQRSAFFNEKICEAVERSN
ncbi:MAG: hypothetical protein GX752_07805 [Clostridium sp.]|nr:hypothetical protein [Clostridium sp.]